MNLNFERARLFFQQRREDLAEPELRLALADDPDDALAHAFLALCLLKKKQFAEATAEAEFAIRSSPHDGFCHYTLAVVLNERNHLLEALAAIERAIEINPFSAANFSVLAELRFHQSRWRDALAAAEQGLSADPQDPACTNLRAAALVKLGRKNEAGATVVRALARDPENAFSHASMGWTLLEQGKRREALNHFRESLRLDPHLDWARTGVVVALKAANPIYRLLLNWMLWMSKLNPQARWLVILGLSFVYLITDSMLTRNPALRPLLLPLIVAYVCFGLLTWLGEPVFNVLLRFNREGRLALTPTSIAQSNWIGCLLTATALLAIVWLITAAWLAELAALMVLGFMLSLTAVFHCDPGWPKKWMIRYTFGLGFLGAAILSGVGLPILLIWLNVDVSVETASRIIAVSHFAGELEIPYAIGILGARFLSMYLMQARPRK